MLLMNIDQMSVYIQCREWPTKSNDCSQKGEVTHNGQSTRGFADGRGEWLYFFARLNEF